MNDVSTRDLARNPEWLPHVYDPDGETLTFVHVPRAERSQLTFLFDENFRDKFRKVSAPAEAVAIELNTTIRAPIQFIFHTSLCGSTLLAKALEIPGISTSMSEPAVLINLANRTILNNDRANANRLELVLELLERPFSPVESVVVKSSNFSNRLIDPILRARKSSQIVLLYSDLETYLISLLKKGLWGRILGRKLFNNLTSWSTMKLDLDPNEILELTDMQVASLAWLMQIQHFDVLAKLFGPRVMPLDSSKMFANPAAVLHEVTTFLNLGLTEKETSDIANGPIFAKHSKFAERDYSVEERQREKAAVSDTNSEELTMVVKWLESFAEHHGIPLKPS